MTKIAIAGFQHETNTFAPNITSFSDFEIADSWPPLLIGEAILSDMQGMNIPIVGAMQAAANWRTSQIELYPIIWCAAEPGGYVSDAAFETISKKICAQLSEMPELDGLYLDLHGAMVTESHEDGEAVLLARLRATLEATLGPERGRDFPIAVSLDLHANMSEALVKAASFLTIYQTYPHLDMAKTGARAMERLLAEIGKPPLKKAFRQIPFLIPLHAQYTETSPCRELYEQVVSLSEAGEAWVDLALGFTAADIPDCGPAVVAYARTQSQADRLADEIFAAVLKAAPLFETQLHTAADAVSYTTQSEAAALTDRQKQKPIVLADVQDNPGAGGTSDTTGLLHALIDHQAKEVAIGLFCDPHVAEQAHIVGLNQPLKIALGERSCLAGKGNRPVEGQFTVKALSNGTIAYTGEMYGGVTANLGLSCLLHYTEKGCDIEIVISSIRVQCLDQALFRHFGVDPAAKSTIAVKSTVHFRADFTEISSEILNVETPGAFPCRLKLEDYTRLRDGVTCL